MFGLNDKLLIAGGVFLGSGFLTYYIDTVVLVRLVNQKWMLAVAGGFAGLGLYLVLQNKVVTALPAAL